VSSTNIIDFSLRQNKSIERLVVFENLRRIVDAFGLEKLVYVGLGSVWFTDFLLAHRELGIDTMVSIEADSVIHKRATFNKPYRTLSVMEGQSSVVLPELLLQADLANRPWIVWLDYDKAMDEGRRDELVFLLRNLPINSSLIVTCNAHVRNYGELSGRVSFLEELFGDAVESGLTSDAVKSEEGFMNVLRETVDRFLLSMTLKSARLGGYESAFSLAYKDGAPMITVGGFLPSSENADNARKLIGSKNWTGRASKAIITPPLTSKEVATLQAQLPRRQRLTRKQVQRLGFDLDETQIESFVTHYLKYPTFAQVAR
jgi:putative O-methyltransferase